MLSTSFSVSSVMLMLALSAQKKMSAERNWTVDAGKTKYVFLESNEMWHMEYNITA